MNDFIALSRQYGQDFLLVQGQGGNTSYKAEDQTLWIKASGKKLGDLDSDNLVPIGYSSLLQALQKQQASTPWSHNYDDNFAQEIKTATLPATYPETLKASMETGMHTLLGKFVFHLHPVSLNAILCSEEAEDLIARLYADEDHLFVECLPPGFYLAQRLQTLLSQRRSVPPIIFLENHGIIISAESLAEIDTIWAKTDSICRQFLAAKGFDFTILEQRPSWQDISQIQHIFPDTVVFENFLSVYPSLAKEKQQDLYDLFLAHHLIEKVMETVHLTPHYLPEAMLSYIRGMKQEKHRQNQL